MSSTADPSPGEALLRDVRAQLAGWREQLQWIEGGSGFDQQRSMLASWIKEGERLVERLSENG